MGFFPFGRCGNEVDYALAAKEREEYAPLPLPARRPRALTAPLPSVPSADVDLPENGQRERKWGFFLRRKEKAPLRHPPMQTTCDQRQCPLMARLPPEIRLAIWKEVLGGLRVHVVRAREKRLLGIRCGEPEEVLQDKGKCPGPGVHDCWGMTTCSKIGYTYRMVGFYTRPTQPVCYANLLPLVKTCRLIYSETVNLLYAENRFSFNHIDTVIRLAQTVLPHRLDQIRVVHLWHYFRWPIYENEGSKADWLPPYDPDTWEECCRALASMTGLEELSLHLCGEAVLPVRDPMEQLLRPLRQVRAPRVFEVSVPWDEDPAEVVHLDDDIPFRIVSRGSRKCCV
ncbi:hypothetical protein VTN77DRAFT_8793 [Rasamsonia byssochlamydoides]|uniref:uncharacterized protein n=1 Tax=Rasamsonia byssochlamydoides TaxID=89139 RepID=UPI003744AC45